MSTRDVVWLAAIIAVVLGLGAMFAAYIVPWDGEWGFVVLGPMLLRGEIRLFQDEIVGQRLPVPFYVIGASQLVVGRSLVAARVTSLLLGAAALAATFALGRALGGRACGFLSALFLATHALVIGYFATA